MMIDTAPDTAYQLPLFGLAVLPVVHQEGCMTVCEFPDGRALLGVNTNRGRAWLELDADSWRWLRSLGV